MVSNDLSSNPAATVNFERGGWGHYHSIAMRNAAAMHCYCYCYVLTPYSLINAIGFVAYLGGWVYFHNKRALPEMHQRHAINKNKIIIIYPKSISYLTNSLLNKMLKMLLLLLLLPLAG